jgi:hypothetical protein
MQRGDINPIVMLHKYDKLMTLHLKYYQYLSSQIWYFVDNQQEYYSRSVVMQRDDINFRVILHYYNQLMTLRLKYYLDRALSSNI